MEFPRYESYKDSGFAWLGRVPDHWKILPFKALFQISQEKNGENIVGEMLSVSGYRGIEIKHYEHEEQKRDEKDLVDYRVVRKEQLVVNTMWLNYAGLGVSEHEGHVSPAYRSYYISDQLHRRYTHYLLRSHSYVQGYTGSMQGIRPNSLQIKNIDFHRFPVLVPAMEEQERIARFLDEKTAVIDTAIAKKERLVALLEEQKQILVNTAVTRGLNPHAPTRPSGINWIGDIPAHWEVKRIKFVSSFITSGPRGWAEYYSDTGSYFLQSGNLNYDVGIELEQANRVTPPQGAEGRRTRLQDNDVLICVTGANTGRVALAKLNGEEVYINQHLSLVRPTNSIHSDYMAYALHSRVGKQHFFLAQYGLKEGLNLDDVKNAPILLPPVNEQVQIAEKIKTKTYEFGEMKQKIQRHIDRLIEYKSILIAEAVTGKIKL